MGLSCTCPPLQLELRHQRHPGVVSPICFRSCSSNLRTVSQRSRSCCCVCFHLLFVHLLRCRNLHIHVPHDAIALRTRYSKHFAVLSASREISAFHIALNPLLQAVLAGIDQVIAVRTWIIIRELASNTICQAAETMKGVGGVVSFALLRCGCHHEGCEARC